MLIAAIQLAVEDGCGRQDRLYMVDLILQEISESGRKPDLILLPEIWGCGFFNFDGYSEEAEELGGSTFLLLSDWAKKLNCYILGGSIIEKSGEKLHNTSLFIDSQGDFLGSYRKMHLFGFESKEQQLLVRGEQVKVFETSFGKVGISTCYDLRFPEQYREMVDRGAEILLIVSAWPEARLTHWRLFNQTRTLENQCWLVSCNCAGVQCGGRYAGHSMTVSPAGEIATEAGEEACVLWSEVDLAEVERMRNTFPALADRVPVCGK